MNTHETTQKEGDVIREYFKKWPKFYYFIVYVFGPVWFTGLSPVAFLRKYARDGKKVNLGSGPRRIHPDVINMDSIAYADVDVVGDVCALPFETGTVAMAVCDNVLEHVSHPQTAADEIYRILQEGGVAYISTPYLYPFHSSPSDFTRWTEQGLRELFSPFTVREIGVRGGTMSSVTVLLCYLAARIFCFGNKRLYWFFVNLFLFVFFPIKFLDIILNLFPFGSHTAAMFYCVIEKKHES